MTRIFQNFDIYDKYLGILTSRTDRSYKEIIDELVDDRFVALHMLLPTLQRDESAMCAIGHDAVSQRSWARGKGIGRRMSQADILRAQIEEHRTEIFYNHDPLRFGSAFVKSLPGCVRRTVAWRAAPSPGADFKAYGLVVCNFHSILEDYRARGWRAAWFAPAFDPEMDRYNRTDDRPTDILFAGSYSQYHKRRGLLLELLASLSGRWNVVLHLHLSRLTTLAGTPAGWLGPLHKYRLPRAIQQIRRPPVFGRDLYRALGSAKIVINGAIDMAGQDRGNMRCWEALGCGALMLSDSGVYPDGMRPGEDLATYSSLEEVATTADRLLRDGTTRRAIAESGNAMIRTRYSKHQQWNDFLDLF
ncbi:glycosyltransferase [uncultured Sphingomonas sp.]|uniref:glycosyltransferase family protein n=1 Tax=uncultured Sphingomonas sp. TaxID=158754 RepID=UPI0035CBEF18